MFKSSLLSFKITALLFLFSTLGCTTTGDKLVVKKMKMTDRVYAGRFIVNFNGRTNENIKCELYINKGLVPDLKITQDGYVFIKSDSKELKITRIACYEQPNFYIAAWHFQSLPLAALFKSDDPKKAVYFGDVYIQWKTDPNETLEAARQDIISPQYPKIGRVENSGLVKVEIRDGFEEMKVVFNERVKNKTWSAESDKFELINEPLKIQSLE